MKYFKLIGIFILMMIAFSCDNYENFILENWEKDSTGDYWYQATWKRTDTYKDIYLDLSSESPIFCGTGGNLDNIYISSVSWNSSYTEGYFTMKDKISGTVAKMLIEKSDVNNLVLSLVDISTGEPYSPGYYTKSDGWCD